MNDLTELIERNRSFATDFDGGELPIAPRFRQVILSCADSRIDPTHFFSLEPGDAVVLRSLGGRVTQGVEEQLGVLTAFAGAMMGPETPSLEIMIVHHTDCALERLAEGQRRVKLSSMSGIDEAVFEALAITDHRACLEADVEHLRMSPLISKGVSIVGYLYDHETGSVQEVCPPKYPVPHAALVGVASGTD